MASISQPSPVAEVTTESHKLRKLAETSTFVPIPEGELGPVLHRAPFIPVPGTFNVRDLGLIDVDHPNTSTPNIRPGFIYRSGALDDLTRPGKDLLRDQLGVRRIFDLRSKSEQTSLPDPDIEGVALFSLRNANLSMADEDAVVDVTEFAEGRGEKGYMAMYCGILTDYKDVFQEVLTSVRDQPSKPILFHCTAGRDRTGVFAAILESLAGYDPKLIQLDWLLSRIGYEPARAKLMQFVGTSAVQNSAESRGPGLENLISLRASCWDAFVGAVEDKYGGFEGYTTASLGFSNDDLAKIKENLKRRPQVC